MEICRELETGITAIHTELSALSRPCIHSADKITLFQQLKHVKTGSKEFCVDKCEDTIGQMIEQVKVMGAMGTLCNSTQIQLSNSTPSENQCFEQVFLALDAFTFNQLMPLHFAITMDIEA